MANEEVISLDTKIRLENRTGFAPNTRVGGFEKDDLFSTNGVFAMKVGPIKAGRSAPPKGSPEGTKGNLKVVMPLHVVKECADKDKKTTKHQPLEGKQNRKDKSVTVWNVDGFYKFLESAGIASVEDIKAFPEEVTIGEMITWLPEGTIVYVECQADLYEEKGTWSTKPNDAIPKHLYDQLVAKGEDTWPLPKECLAWIEAGGKAKASSGPAAGQNATGASGTNAGAASGAGGNAVLQQLREKAAKAAAERAAAANNTSAGAS